MMIVWYVPAAIFAVAGLIALIALLVNLTSTSRRSRGTTTAPTPGATPGTTAVTPQLDWWKTQSQKEWVQAAGGGVITIFLLWLLNPNLAWWLSGHHPRLFVSLVGLVVLGIFVLKKNYAKTKKWLWRVGFAIVLVFGLGGAILEDWHKDEPNLDEVILGSEQREVLKGVAQEVAAVMPEVSMPTLPSLSPAVNAAPVLDPVDRAKQRPGAVVYNVGPQGARLPVGPRHLVWWRGRADIATDTGVLRRSVTISDRPYIPTKSHLEMVPLEGTTEVVITPW